MDDAAVRRRTMQAVRSENTNPELIVRRLAHGLGYRYRLYRKELPGKPDLVFVGRRKAVFVHGCFWHGHNCARGARTPISNREYWVAKIGRNRLRDKAHKTALAALGWKSLAIWECELKRPALVQKKLTSFLGEL